MHNRGDVPDLPRDENLSSGPALEGFYEYYFSGRTSMRIGFGWAEPESDVDDEDSLRILRVPFDIVYNWEGGAIHPFVGLGLGAYFLQLKDNGRSFGDSETKLGATLFGGAEFFTGRTTSLKAEARYHIVDERARHRARRPGADDRIQEVLLNRNEGSVAG